MRKRHRAGHHRRAGCELSKTALDAPRRTGGGAEIRANSHAVLFAGQRPGNSAKSSRHAWRARGYHFTGNEQFAIRSLGLALDVVAGAGARVPSLAYSAAVRSFQTHDCGHALGFIWLG